MNSRDSPQPLISFSHEKNISFSSCIHSALVKLQTCKERTSARRLKQNRQKKQDAPAGDEKMKANGTLSAKNLFAAIAACFALSAFSSASAADVPSKIQSWPAHGAFEHCGCDTKKGVQVYVQNLINDSQQRGLNCGMSMHVPACITAYCSSCAGHSGIMESCMKTGMEYFASSCGQQPQLTASAYGLPMQQGGGF